MKTRLQRWERPQRLSFWDESRMFRDDEGEWVNADEAESIIKKLEAEKTKLLEALEEANKNTMLYDGHPGRYANVIAKVKGEQQ